jgi:D-serine deaminase-like pyridoxal phosphate-dependent protein
MEGAKGLNAVARRHGLKLEVLIHVDSGNRRSGVLLGEPTLKLAKEVVKLQNLDVRGIFTHEGHNYTGRTPAEVLSITKKAGEDMVGTKKLLEKELGIEVYNSVGSTPGAKPLARMPGIDEIRPGAYVFYDEGQVFMGVCERKDIAFAVLSQVFSRPAPDRAVCDAGSKGYYPPGEYLAFTEEGLQINWPLPSTGGGVVRGLDGEVYEDIVFHRWGEEYGMLTLYDPTRDLKIGDLIEILPYHCCSTVNLYDELIGVRKGEVELTWPILARGKVR